jgi:hypothetical protein
LNSAAKEAYDNFDKNHPYLYGMHEKEKRWVLLAKRAGQRYEYHFTFWFDNLLAHQNEIMISTNSTSKQKWVASSIAVALIYFQVFLFGVLPVCLSTWALLKLPGDQAKSWHFLFAVLPFPMLIQMIYASILATIDSKRHKMWVLDGELEDHLKAAGVGETLQTSGRTGADYTGVFMQDRRQAELVAEAMRRAKKKEKKNKHGSVDDDGTGDEDNFSTKHITVLPEPVDFPEELHRTWLREWLLLTIIFFGATVWLGFSHSGQAALSDCGWKGLEKMKESSLGYSLVKYEHRCGPIPGGDPTYSDQYEWEFKADTKLTCSQKCASYPGCKFFNFGVQGNDNGRCVGVNATRECDSSWNVAAVRRTTARLPGTGFVGTPDWEFFAIVSYVDGRDDCGCKEGWHWSTKHGGCLKKSYGETEHVEETTASEALACREGVAVSYNGGQETCSS